MGSGLFHVSHEVAPAHVPQFRKESPFPQPENYRGLPTPASIDLRWWMLDLVPFGLRLEPTQDKINGLVAIEGVPIDNARAEKDSPEKITSLLVYCLSHNAYIIGIASKNLTPVKKSEPSPCPSRQSQAGFRGWGKGDTGTKNMEAPRRQSIKKARVDQMHRFSRH